MYHWEDLISVYSSWRWSIYRNKSKNPSYSKALNRGVKLRLHCNMTTRLNFSEYAKLPKVISKESMKKLENNFWEDR